MADEFCLKMPDFHVTFRYLLHAVNLRHGTNGFTSLPKEGLLRIFSPWKIRRLRPGSNPRTWVPKASTLPLDLRSRFSYLTYLLVIPEVFGVVFFRMFLRNAFLRAKHILRTEDLLFQCIFYTACSVMMLIAGLVSLWSFNVLFAGVQWSKT